jgi:hypothetical protein
MSVAFVVLSIESVTALLDPQCGWLSPSQQIGREGSAINNIEIGGIPEVSRNEHTPSQDGFKQRRTAWGVQGGRKWLQAVHPAGSHT